MSVELWWEVTDRDRRKLKEFRERNRMALTWIILTFHLCLGLPSGLFPSCSHSKPFTGFSSPPYGLPTIMKLLALHFSPVSCHFPPLGPKYFPQPPVLKRAQRKFFSSRDTPSDTSRNGVPCNLAFGLLDWKIRRRHTSVPEGSSHRY